MLFLFSNCGEGNSYSPWIDSVMCGIVVKCLAVYGLAVGITLWPGHDLSSPVIKFQRLLINCLYDNFSGLRERMFLFSIFENNYLQQIVMRSGRFRMKEENLIFF